MRSNRSRIQSILSILLNVFVIQIFCFSSPVMAQAPANQEDCAPTLRILTYNTFCRPFVVSHDGQHERTALISESIAKQIEAVTGRIDIIVFQEAFQKQCRRNLETALRKLGFSYFTNVLDGKSCRARFQNGGVFIASRHKFEETAPGQERSTEKALVYCACKGNDCLAKKGVLYIRIIKGTGEDRVTYHIFGTHLQANLNNDKNQENKKARRAQSHELKEFIANQSISPQEPVLIVGDLNIDSWSSSTELTQFLATLQAAQPKTKAEPRPSVDPAVNPLVGEDGSASEGKCKTNYYRTQRCSCCPPLLLDYALCLLTNRRPVEAASRVIRLTAPRPLRICMAQPFHFGHVSVYSSSCRSAWSINDLSDHFAVLTELNF